MGESWPDPAAVIGRWIEAFNRRDLDAALESFHPEARIDPARLCAPPGAVYHGRAGARSYIEDALRRRPDLRLELLELEPVGRRLLARLALIDDPRSGSDREREVAVLCQTSGARIARLEAFTTEADARAAAERSPDERLETVFHQAPVPIALLDEEGRFLDANSAACALYGLGIEGLRDRAVLDFVAPQCVVATEEFLRESRVNGPLTGEFELMPQNGGRRSSVQFRAAAGNVAGRDVTVLIACADPAGGLTDEAPRLTPRQRDVFRLLALGLTAREIATQLSISPDTVRTHVQNGTVSLEAKTRVQAVAMALTQGEIELDGASAPAAGER